MSNTQSESTRTRRLYVRLSDAEYEYLARLARAEGRTMGSYLRRCARLEESQREGGQ